MRKKLTFLLIAILASLGAMASPPHQDEGNVAKVGNTEYATIEEAVAAWGPGKTLTLLSDVTTTSTVTVEVNATKSTQNWILELGDYTWTANGCNAFEVYAAGGTPIHGNYGLKVYANQHGGVTASGKYAFRYYDDKQKVDKGYRARVEINGGTYNAAYVFNYDHGALFGYVSSSTLNGASVFLDKSKDGSEPVFNGNFELSKCRVEIKAGYFNGTTFKVYRVTSTVDPCIYGGHFKEYKAFPVPGNNKGLKFDNYRVFVKSDASIDVVNGAPAEYEAKATKTLLLSTNQSKDYPDYVYYEKADDAIKKYASGNIEVILSNNVTASENKSYTSGTLTIDASAEGSAYTGNITLNGANAKFIVKFPEGGGHYGVSAKSPGRIHVEETVADGIVTRTYSYLGTVANPEAKIGDTGYSTVYDAFYAVDGTTDNKVIVLQKDVTNAGIVTNGTATGGDGKTVATFDLNGKSIGIGSVAAGNNADYTLTIIDSSEEKTGTVTNSDASLFILALTGINDYSGSYKLKIQAGTWQFNPSAVVIKGETHDLVDEGYVARDNGNGTWTVGELPYVAQYKENKYRTLQAALDAAKDVDDLNIVIDLLDDVTLDIDAWDGTKNKSSIGTVNTQSITINGNNHKLDFVNKNSDWNNVATMNDAQTKLILNNMTITNSGYNDGPWNRHDINFNCAVELNNVTSDKALAFKNSATLKNVTITETRVVKDGDYCIWISPRVENQTVTIDALTATATNTNKNGRGIKVDDQYVGNPYRVTLSIAKSTFTTDKKAAILLKSAGGVDVIDGGNNNIENVAADKVNLVWVDEDKAEEFYKYSLTSSTAKMVPESKESDYVARLSDAEGKILGYYKGTNAIANAVGKADTGYTVTIFQPGSYAMPALPKNITVEAAENVEGVVFNHTASGNVASVPNGATFKNLTFNFDNNNYHGFQHAGPINMEDCTLNGKLSSYGNMNFTNCDFNQTNSDYNMWCYDGDLTYTNCTFTNEATGKFLNLYNEGNGAHKVTVTGCKFVNKVAASNKAALNVKATCGSTLLTYDVYITKSTTEGAFPVKGDLCYENGVETGIVVDPLAQVDDRTADGVDYIRVWKDDFQIYPLNYVAQVENKKYESFSEAVTAAAGTKVIVLLKDIADTYAMTQGETLKVQKDGKAFNDPTAPADFTLKTLIDGAVTIYSVKANENLASISEGYYHIKNLGNGKYVNVKGRRTATVDATADDASTAAGTIIKVKATNGQVEVLRSQAIDIPHYADRAMSYVHDFAKILVEKLNASGSGEILGTTGYEAIMKKFDDNFDHHLYVEQAQDGYRIFGRTPSMKPVVEFYQENKDKVDAKLPMLEQKINDAIAKVVDKVGKGSSLKDSFKLHTIWQRMNNSALTEPNDDATKLAFLQEVLSSEINVWNFAYESATFYMEKVEGSQYFEQIPAEIRNYWNLAKQVHPDFKYYIVQKDGKMDFISEGNTDIIHNNLRTVWALEQVDKMTVSVPEENSRVVGATFDEAGKRTGFETAYYTTLYTDFGYQLPEGVTALKVTKIKDTYLVKQKPENKITYESDGVTLGLGLLETKEIGQDVPAQTPVLIMSKSAEPFQITIGDSYGASADVTDNLLHGADWLINEYEINTPALESLFALVEGKVSESITDKYEHLLRRNSGTVNNKYFFPISVEEDLAPAYKNKTGYKMQISPVLVLGKKEGKKLAFNETKDVIQANSVFLFSEENKPALFTLTGDVTRDGIIDVEDVTGQVNIVQKRDKKDYKYDYDAADVVVGETYYVDVDDVTRVLNIIQKRTDHPDLP